MKYWLSPWLIAAPFLSACGLQPEASDWNPRPSSKVVAARPAQTSKWPAKSGETLVPEPREWHALPVPEESTTFPLSPERQALLVGTWIERDTLWDDTALVFTVEGKELHVLDGGASESIRLWKHTGRLGALLFDLAWSADGSKLYRWLDMKQQLCAMDARTGEIESLLELDSHLWHYEGMRHLDPKPQARDAGVLEDAAHRRIILLFDEESNKDVAIWQRREGRGGAWLAALDVDDHSLHPLFDKSTIRDSIVSWDLSPKRGEFYAITLSHQVTEYHPDQQRLIQARRLDGSLVWYSLGTPGRGDELQLAPNQDMLLIERSYLPDFAIPSGTTDEMGREQLQAVVQAQGGGFLITDLRSGRCWDGPRSGQEARWAPDSDRIAYVDGWAVKLCSVRDGSITPLIEGDRIEDDWYYGTWIDPVWSPDGRRLAITGRAIDTTLLLDLERREYFVIRKAVSRKIWALTPRPFADAASTSDPHDSRDFGDERSEVR